MHIYIYTSLSQFILLWILVLILLRTLLVLPLYSLMNTCSYYLELS